MGKDKNKTVHPNTRTLNEEIYATVFIHYSKYCTLF